MDISSIISANLTAWMAETPGLDTLQKVEAKSGVGFGTVRRVKNGDSNATIDKLDAIASAFGRTAAELVSQPTSRENTHSGNYPSPPQSPPAGIEEDRKSDAYSAEQLTDKATSLARQASELAATWLALPPDQREALKLDLAARSTGTVPASVTYVTLQERLGSLDTTAEGHQNSWSILPNQSKKSAATKKKAAPKTRAAGE